MNRSLFYAGVTLVSLLAIAGTSYAVWPSPEWTDEEKRAVEDLWIRNLPPLMADPTNAVAEDQRAIELGYELFFDTRLSGNGQVACATCHQPGRAFTDGLPLGQGVGTAGRKTPTIVGAAYSPWQFWDGREDSLWAQALGPLESAVEHGGARTGLAIVVAEHYRDEYEALFGPLPDLSDPERFPPHAAPVAEAAAREAWDGMDPEDQAAVTEVFVNIGKAIAAYERLIVPGPSRFDDFVAALLHDDRAAMSQALTADEIAGLRLFIGKANCTECHSGPLLTNNDFHNVGTPAREGMPPDDGRASGAPQVFASAFNCLGPYSDAGSSDCVELRFLKVDGHELDGAFKTPTLRMLEPRAPYMHAGQLASLEDVVDHYNRAPVAAIGHTELEPLGLTEQEVSQIVAFLRALDGPIDAPPELLAPPGR